MLGPLRRAFEVNRPWALGAVSVSHGVNEFFSIVVPPIIPLLVSDLGITYGQAGFLLTVFFLMYSLFQLPAGMLADRIGKSRLLVGGLLCMAVGIALAGTADGYGTLVIGQAVAGIGGSTFHPTGMSLVSDLEQEKTEGKAMGVFGFGGAVGTMTAPLVVGGLAAVANWRVALGGAAVVGLVATLVTVPTLRETGRGGDGIARPDGGRPSSVREAATVVREAIAVPVTPGIVLLFLMTFVLSLQHRAIQTYTTSYVTAETGVTVGVGNLTFFALLLGGSVASLYAGDLADRVSREALGVGTAVATAVLVGATLFVTRALGPLSQTVVVGTLAVWFGGIGMMMYASYPVKNALVSEAAEEAYSGSLFGVIQTASALGSASGPALFGVLATRFGVVAAFPAIAGVSVVLAALYIVLGRVR